MSVVPAVWEAKVWDHLSLGGLGYNEPLVTWSHLFLSSLLSSSISIAEHSVILEIKKVPSSPGTACPNLESVGSPKSPESFWWGMELETKIWAQGVSIATEVLLLLGPFSRQN